MKNTWRSTGAGAALIVLLTGVAYLPALRGGFVFDDHELITENRMVHASDGLYRFWFTNDSPDYRPLTWSLWWLEWRLWDGRATGYHVVNVMLQAVDSVLVWLILRQLKIPGAWLAAAVFAIHPVNVATVAWISEQKNTLSMLFYAVAILLYLKFDEEGRSPRSSVRGWRWYGLSLAAFFLALLSKTAVVMLPVVLLGCVWWQRGRVPRRDWLCSVPYFVASSVSALVTIIQHEQALPDSFVRPGGFAARLAMAGWVPWFYLFKALVPFNLTVIYPKWEGTPTHWISYVLGVVLLGAFVVFWRKRATWGRPLLFGLGYFVVMLFPVLGFFDQGFYYCTLVADHWQYYAIVGVIALATAAGQRIGNRMGERRQYVAVAAGVVVLVVLGVATWKRGSVYADEETLWRDNVAKNPNAFLAYNGLGFALVEQGRLTEAMEQYQTALRIRPDCAEVHYNLGVALARLGRMTEAMGQWEQALRIRPEYAEAHGNLGSALGQAGRMTEAIAHFEQALRIRPDLASAHYNLGGALVQVGRLEEGIGHWEEAVRIEPDYAMAYNSLGSTLLRLGRVQEAINDLKRAVWFSPDNAELHYNLGVALERTGRLQEAMEHYEQALRLKPDYAKAQNRLAGLRAVP